MSVIDRSQTRDTPRDPSVGNHRFHVWTSRRGTHLGSGRVRPHQQTVHMIAIASIHTLLHSCEQGAVHIWVPALPRIKSGVGRDDRYELILARMREGESATCPPSFITEVYLLARANPRVTQSLNRAVQAPDEQLYCQRPFWCCTTRRPRSRSGPERWCTSRAPAPPRRRSRTTEHRRRRPSRPSTP
jgi:hypothetical protein